MAKPTAFDGGMELKGEEGLMLCRIFWWMLRRTYPWIPLMIALWHLLMATGSHRPMAQVRFWKLYSRIDFANLLAIANELIQPEFWI